MTLEAPKISITGRVTGYLVEWDKDLGVLKDRCVRPPRSHAGYGAFHRHHRSGGDYGRVTYGQNAPAKLSAEEAMRWYDEQPTIALVNVYEHERGLWMIGRGDTMAIMLGLVGRPLFSPHWCQIDGHLELVGIACRRIKARKFYAW